MSAEQMELWDKSEEVLDVDWITVKPSLSTGTTGAGVIVTGVPKEDKSTTEPLIDPQVFRDKFNRYRTKSLFIEMPHAKYPTFFTLKEQDKDGAVSMYRKYMEIADPTEFEVSQKLLGSWKHWKVLTNSKWFQNYIISWREELNEQIKSATYQTMRDLSRQASSESAKASATRWIANRGWEGEIKTPKRGRPSKEEISGNLKNALQELEEVDEDAERIGLK